MSPKFKFRVFIVCLGAILATAGQQAFAAGGGGGYSSNKDEFETVYELIDEENFQQAYKELQAIEVDDREADRLNLLGFTSRKSGNYEAAGEYYEQALAIDPKHLGALEYQGELFITLGQLDKAKENLAKIDDVCWFSCDEEDQLREAIEAATGQ